MLHMQKEFEITNKKVRVHVHNVEFQVKLRTHGEWEKMFQWMRKNLRYNIYHHFCENLMEDSKNWKAR